MHLMPTKYCSQPPREFGCTKNRPLSWNSPWGRVASSILAVLSIISMRQIASFLHLLPESVCLSIFASLIEINCVLRVLVPFVTRDAHEM